jgi:phospholipase D1/2
MAASLPQSPKARIALLVAVSLVPAILLALAWRYTPLAEYASTRDLIGWLQMFAGKWWAPILVVLLYTPVSILMFPRPVLTLASVMAFGAWKGFAFAMAGVLIASAIGWYAGRRLKEKTVHRLAGKRLARITQGLRREGFFAVLAVRILPVAPFFVESVVAGAVRIKLRDLLLGTAVGMLPGIAGTTIIGDQIAAAFTEGRNVNAWIIVGAVVVLVVFTYGARRWFKRFEERN